MVNAVLIPKITQNIRFQGQYFDAESGLHYNRHRYYDPTTGRYITQDPIGLAGGLNSTQYVKNPTGWVDPLGLTGVPCDDACKVDPIKIDPMDPKFRSHSPIDIPDNARVRGPELKSGGYHQISYKWNATENGRAINYEARWHEATPGSPPDTANNWRVTKIKTGTSTGLPKESFELMADSNNKKEWITTKKMYDALMEKKQGTATDIQLLISKNIHFDH